MDKINENTLNAIKEQMKTISSYKVWYEDAEKLRISFTTLVIRVDSINRFFGSLSNFALHYSLTGVTNGKLFLMAEMQEVPKELDRLVVQHLKPMGLIYEKDMFYTYDQPSFDINDSVNPEINMELPECKRVTWLGSEISCKGCFVWFENESKS